MLYINLCFYQGYTFIKIMLATHQTGTLAQINMFIFDVSYFNFTFVLTAAGPGKINTQS